MFELYQPIYEQFEQEVLAFEQEFSLSDVMDDEEQNARLLEKDTSLCSVTHVY